MTIYLVIRDFDNEAREEGPELTRAEPKFVGAALQRFRPGQQALVAELQKLLDDAPPRVFDFDDPQILMSRRLLFIAEELSVQFSAYDDETKEEARYAHYDRPEDPIRFSDSTVPNRA
ncbi:MAG TPA: hypothetical protein VFR27_15115 [Mycobacterium sp.]|nr:hypothetical protein [Mycobacterium sp.]